MRSSVARIARETRGETPGSRAFGAGWLIGLPAPSWRRAAGPELTA